MPVDPALVALAAGLSLTAVVLTLVAGARRARALLDLAAAIRESGDGGHRLRLHPRGKALAEVEIELNALLSRFDESRRENLRMQRDRRLMISHVAHDLRTPLTSALGYVDALIGDASLEAGERDEYLRVVRRKCVLLSDLVDDFFTLSGLELGEAPPALGRVDLCAVAERVLVAFYADATALGIEPEILIPGHPVPVLAAPLRVERVISNLLSNAIRHGKGATRLAFIIEEDGRRATCRVRNDGSGIDPAGLAELMERPFGAEGGSGRGARGLGLSIVKRLVEGMGGEVSIAGDRGAGTEIAFSLPLADNAPD